MEDPHANFKAEVACYAAADPMPALGNLSAETGIPVDQLIRYVLVKWTASGAEALLTMGPIVFEQMSQHITLAEDEGTDAAKLRAYESLRAMVAWLAAGA